MSLLELDAEQEIVLYGVAVGARWPTARNGGSRPRRIRSSGSSDRGRARTLPAGMRAVVQDSYGSPDDLELREIEPPLAGRGEVLVRVHAASVHPDVWHVVCGRPYFLRIMGAGLRRPRRRVPGTDMAGRVEAVGRDVTGFEPGDAVFGEIVRGHQWHNGGAFAEYAAVRAYALPRSRPTCRSSRPPPCRRRG